MTSASLLRIALIQALAVLVLLEICGRVFDPMGISYYPETAAYLDTLILEEPLGYKNRPNLKGRFFGHEVHINSLGMRDREIDPRTTAETRIMVLGDSIPFGIGVDYEHAFPFQLEVILRETLRRDFRVLNMGVPSYNTEQEYLQLKTIGLSLHPDLVLLLFTSNDLESRMWVFEKRGAWYTDLAQRSYAVSLLYTLYRRLTALAGRVRQADSSTPMPGIVCNAREFPATPASGEKWNRVAIALTNINRLLMARHIPFAVFSLNEAPDISTALDRIAERSGFPYLNLETLQDPRWAEYPFRQISNSAVDSHPNALGNRIIATAIAESLLETGLVKAGKSRISRSGGQSH